MTTRRRWLQAIVLLVALSSVACGAAAPSSSPTPTPTTSPDATGALMSVESRGGLCANGPCGTTIVVDRDGRVRQAAKPPNDLGIVPAADLAALVNAINTTDFNALRSHPFTGTCPVAFDGQELVFEFDAPTGIERIESCQVEVDFGAPLFVAVANVMAPYIALPGND